MAKRGSLSTFVLGAVTMPLDRGDYRVEHASFPLAFFEQAGRPLLVHATAWNRLDISDPVNWAVTDRAFGAPPPGMALPEHDLNYFHGNPRRLAGSVVDRRQRLGLGAGGIPGLGALSVGARRTFGKRNTARPNDDSANRGPTGMGHVLGR